MLCETIVETHGKLENKKIVDDEGGNNADEI